MASKIETRTDTVFTEWEKLPTDEARRNALADMLITVESSSYMADLLDALENATKKQRHIIRLLKRQLDI